jgi:ATP-dependent DNA helicase RecG
MSDLLVFERLFHKARSDHFEHLPEADADEIAKVLCGFLNSGGGTLIARLPQGQGAAQVVKSLEMDLRNRLQPPAFWTATAEDSPGGAYCIFDVPAGQDGPYSASGKIFVRRNKHSMSATSDTIGRMVETGYHDRERWERRPISGNTEETLERLDRSEIMQTVETGRQRHHFAFDKPGDPLAILKDLGMVRQRQITNAAEVLFGKRPAVQFPQIRARVTVYETDKGGKFKDSRVFDQSVFAVMEKVMEFLLDRIPVESTFPSGLRRVDKPAYPERAVREGLVNAFVHRDYADFSGGVSVDVYPKRLVIWNSGQLPPGIKIGDLKHEHPSMPRNPDMAQVFWLRQYMDRVGRGTQNIAEWCAEAGCRVQWSTDATGVTLTLHSSQRENGVVKLNRRQQALLAEMKSTDETRLPDCAKRFAVSERQARRDLTDMVEGGWLERQGDGPTTVFIRTPKAWNPDKPGQTRTEEDA